MAYILVVDDEEKMQHLLSIMLVRRGYSVDRTGDGEKALALVRENPYDLVISDIRMPKMDGMALLSEMKAADIHCPVVFITAFATVDAAVEAMRRGAADYITKPFEEERILLTVERTLGISRLISENIALKQRVLELSGGRDIIYASEKMTRIMESAAKVAASEAAVLITGESGTGKEVVAGFIHDSSPRSKGRFVPVNCAAISPTLVESELFGYEKGAFTGADRQKKGRMELAHQGTLFIDEVGEIPKSIQVKLLRVIQEKTMTRIGGARPIYADFRLIAATNRDLAAEVAAGRFREDLYYRLNVIPVTLPPLRDRREDVLLLARHFLHRFAAKYNRPELALLPDHEAVLARYAWPGNVRELQNVMERAVLLSADGTLNLDLPSGTPGPSPAGFDDLPTLDEIQRRYIAFVVEKTRGKISGPGGAAGILGIKRTSLYNRMKKLGIR